MKNLKNKTNKSQPIADIHTHILHSVDDGSSSIDESLELLKREKRQGVTRVALTPHFNLEKITVEAFLKKRDEKYNQLLAEIKSETKLQNLSLHLGAEVAYTPNIIKSDVKKLVIEGTNCILLELPTTDPFYLDETLDFFRENDIVPILAHVERYGYLHSAKKLKYYKNKGVIIQSNISTLFNRSSKSFVVRMIKKGYIDILASDSHNISTRPPVWDEALKFLDNELEEKIKCNALELFSDGKKQQTI